MIVLSEAGEQDDPPLGFVGLFGRSWMLVGGSAAAAIAVALAVTWAWNGPAPQATPATAAPASPTAAAQKVVRTAAPEPNLSLVAPGAIRTLPAAEQLTFAFRTVFGGLRTPTVWIEGSIVAYEPERLLWYGDRAVLITVGTNRTDCHACAGALGVHYLRAAGNRFELIGSWPAAVEGWGYGAPPQIWSISNRFTRHPAIYAEGHFMGQGIICRSATLTELGPDGPVRSDLIWTGYSNEGATDEAERLQDLNGAIADIRRDRSFEVRFTGTDRFTERYVRRGNRFTPAAETRIPCV